MSCQIPASTTTPHAFVLQHTQYYLILSLIVLKLDIMCLLYVIHKICIVHTAISYIRSIDEISDPKTTECCSIAIVPRWPLPDASASFRLAPLWLVTQ